MDESRTHKIDLLAVARAEKIIKFITVEFLEWMLEINSREPERRKPQVTNTEMTLYNEIEFLLRKVTKIAGDEAKELKERIEAEELKNNANRNQG